MKKRCLLLLFFLLFSSTWVSGHGGEEHETTAEAVFHLWDPFWMLFAASITTVFIVFLSLLFFNRLTDPIKRIFFCIIAVSLGLATLYLVLFTIRSNIISETKGPVHWHADFEIWVCGQRMELPESEGFSNKVGTPLFHHHNDYRIHVEGVVKDLSDVRLGNFFRVIGGTFTEDTLGIPQEDGSVAYFRNGDLCPDGNAGTLKLFVNDELNQALDNYLIAPHSDVPPGDVLKIVFE